MNFNIGDKVWFIKHYFPKYPNRPFDTYKICKGVLKDIIPNVKIIISDLTISAKIISNKPALNFDSII